MDQSLRRASVLQRDLKVLNQKEERDLQQKLNTLDRQYRYTRKRLQQRRDALVTELGRVVMVKVVEPQATVNIAMREIGERAFQTQDSRRWRSGKSQHHSEGCVPAEPSRSTSAPSVQPASGGGSVRRRGRVQSSVSLMQMKNIATIDSISEKELARQQRLEREELERLRRIQRETLHNRVAAFIEKLRDKRDMEIHAEPP